MAIFRNAYRNSIFSCQISGIKTVWAGTKKTIVTSNDTRLLRV